MAGQDGTVVVPTVTPGTYIDNTSLTQGSSGLAVQRQRVDVPNPIWAGGDVMTEILVELRLINHLMATAFGIQEDLNAFRNDLLIETETQ